MFDELFRETLSNAPSAVPPAAWEGISSSLGHAAAAGATGAVVQSALWLKAVVAATVIGAAATGVWYFTSQQPETSDSAMNAPVQTEFPEADNAENQSTQSYTSSDKPIVQEDNKLGTGKTPSGTPETAPLTVQSPYGNAVEFTYGKTGTFQFRMPEMETPETSDKTIPAEPAVKNQQAVAVDDAESNTESEYERAGELLTPPAIVDSSYILVPDVFTPDGDGINDSYQIVLIGEERYELIIFSPKDNSILFRSKNKYQYWNARMPNGDPAPSGTYVAKVIYKFKNKKEESKWVKITLIR